MGSELKIAKMEAQLEEITKKLDLILGSKIPSRPTIVAKLDLAAESLTPKTLSIHCDAYFTVSYNSEVVYVSEIVKGQNSPKWTSAVFNLPYCGWLSRRPGLDPIRIPSSRTPV